MSWPLKRASGDPGELTIEALNKCLRPGLRVEERSVHGDTLYFSGRHDDYLGRDVVLAGEDLAVANLSAYGVALTVAAGAAAAVELKKPVTRRGLFTLGWFRGEDK